jgi:pyruvate dehydrogenase E1 component alpha subunit
MRGDIADGMDVLDVYEHAKEAVDRARNGEGPTLLELKTFRLCGHSRRDPNNYMTEEEKEDWKKRDPIPFFERLLIEEGILEDEEVVQIKKDVDMMVEKALEFVQNSPYPSPEELYDGLYVTMEVPR